MPLVEVSQTNIFRAALKSTPHLVVVDFYAPWCGPCRSLNQTFVDITSQFKNVLVIKADVDNLAEISTEFNVARLPTVVFIRFGRELDRVVGADSKAIINKVITYAV